LETRDIVQTVYIRWVEGRCPANIEFDKHPDAKDPGSRTSVDEELLERPHPRGRPNRALWRDAATGELPQRLAS
jgi:hypothetical protein